MIESAQIIAVGDEVLWGETVNTNAAWMANFLMSFGVRPTYHCVVPDQESAIGRALHEALEVADLAVVIGGLGPTADDRTVDAVSQKLKRSLRVDADTLTHISGRHSHSAGWQDSVRRQSRAIEGALLWRNPRGQAPGQMIRVGSRYVVLLPGPPREMQGIAEEWMAGWLKELTRGPIRRDTYSVFDLGESAVASYLGPLLQGPYPHLGIYAQPGRIDIRLETKDTPQGAVLRERGRAWLLTQIPAPIFELGDTSREAFLLQWLAHHGLSIAAMESLTGGLVLSSFIAVPGASQVVGGGLVAYSDAAKVRYGVPVEILQESGAVSAECARAMAVAARREFEVSVGVATTGFAGPDGGTAENPVGTFFAAAVSDQGEVVRRRYVPLERQSVRRIAVQTAISAIWELLQLPVQLREQKLS